MRIYSPQSVGKKYSFDFCSHKWGIRESPSTSFTITVDFLAIFLMEPPSYIHIINTNCCTGFTTSILSLFFLAFWRKKYYFFAPFWLLLQKYPTHFTSILNFFHHVKGKLLQFSCIFLILFTISKYYNTDFTSQLTDCGRIHCLLIEMSLHAWKLSTNTCKWNSLSFKFRFKIHLPYIHLHTLFLNKRRATKRKKKK